MKLGQTHESTDDVKVARKEEFQRGDVCKKLLAMMMEMDCLVIEVSRMVKS